MGPGDDVDQVGRVRNVEDEHGQALLGAERDRRQVHDLQAAVDDLVVGQLRVPLGVGVPVTETSLGLLISNGFEYMMSGKYWISIYPGIALLVTIVSINLVGDRLRDVLNPRLAR